MLRNRRLSNVAHSRGEVGSDSSLEALRSVGETYDRSFVDRSFTSCPLSIIPVDCISSIDWVQDNTSSCWAYVATSSSASNIEVLLGWAVALGTPLAFRTSWRLAQAAVRFLCVPIVCTKNGPSGLPVVSRWLAISNAPVACRLHRSAHYVAFPERGSGNMHGLRNATEVRTEPLPILAANATSTYPTPGNRIFPATTWSEKSSSADGVSTPEKTTVSLTGEPKSLGFSASQFSRVSTSARGATMCLLR